VSLEPGRLEMDLRPLRRLDRPARPASFRVVGERVVIVPSRPGSRIDVERLARRLAERPALRRVAARPTPVRPSRTTADARALGIRRRISTFTTGFSCCQPRVTNIRLAARTITGTIVPAGGTFSLNQVLGERTTARGYQAAPQINAGRLEDAVGGGVSQVATTVYNAAFFGGMELVQHTPHEFYISRYPAGREATVSWGGPELVFRNDWPAAVLVQATTTDTSITVSLYSSPLGRRVVTEEPVLDGLVARYPRKVYRGDSLRRDESWSWTYRPGPA
jgi:vancomycin resistance protein YoaR